MKTNKEIDEVSYLLTEETKADKRLNPIDKDVLALLQFFGNVKILQHNKNGWFPLSIKSNPKLKSLTLQDMLKGAGIKADYTTIYRSVCKLVSLGYIEYKTGYWNNQTFSGSLPYFHILHGTIPTLIETSKEFIEKRDCNNGVTCTNTESNGDIAITIYKDNEERNCDNFLTTSTNEGYSDIAITIEKEKEIEKEIYKEKVKRKDKELMNETTTNTSTENELGFSNTSTATAEDIKRDYYNHINLNVPEWMIEMDAERNGEQPTNPSTFNYSREDEEREYKQHFKRMNYTGTNNTYPQRESEKVITPVSPCCPPSPSQTAKTAPQSAQNTVSGTTTHTEDKSPAEGAKTPSTKEERKAFTEKWHSIKNDMINGKYSPKQCEYLFKRVIKDIPQYFSGEWVETITKNWSNDYEGIKYQIRGYETYEMLKEIRASNETEKPQQYLNYHVDGLPD